MRRDASFTLIELLVAIAIISIIALALLPALARARQESRGSHAEVREIAQPPPTAVMIPATAGASVRAPVLESSEITVELSASPVLEGLAVYTRYEARFIGTFVVRNIDAASDRIHFSFPFPTEMAVARDVTLQTASGSGRLEEPPDAEYSVGGVQWQGRVAPNETVRLVVSYTAEGRNAFGYRPTGAGRSGRVHVEVRLLNGRRPTIPASSLTPTEILPDRLVWSLNNLVTQRAIVVELPPGSSPLGRLVLLCQLSGLAVLLFGAGFWYLNELRRPGGLDDFHLGQFLLLALNYCLFFVVFAVVGYSGSVEMALAVAAVAGLPLLAVHGVRITDASFAFTRILPLAAFTLALVIGGVYVEEGTEYVYLAGGIVTLGFVTLTYRRWGEGRLAYRETMKKESRLRGREDDLRHHWEALGPIIENAAETLEEAERTKREAGGVAPAAREIENLQASAEAVGRLVAQAPAVEAEIGQLRGCATAVDHAVKARALEAAVKRHKEQLLREGPRLEAAIRALRECCETIASAPARAGTPPAAAGAAHCVACGAKAPALPWTPYCAHCGVPSKLSMTCSRCSHVVEIPLHVMRTDWRTGALYCPACGGRLEEGVAK